MHDSLLPGGGERNDPFLASLAAGLPPSLDGPAPWERPPPPSPLAGEGADCDDTIVERLGELADSAVPLRRVLAKLAGRFVSTKAWERLSFARLSDYTAERVGLSARQLYELARVDEALNTLPGVEAALLSGHLSWTKARLLCRVATPRDEARWLGVAAGMSARALAREVRQVDARSLERGGANPPRGEELERVKRQWAPEGEEVRETLRVPCMGSVQAKWWAARKLATRMTGRPLKHWECAEWVAAEVLSAVGLEVEVEDEAWVENEAESEPLADASQPDENAMEILRARLSAIDGVTAACDVAVPPGANADAIPGMGVGTIADRADGLDMGAGLVAGASAGLDVNAGSGLGAGVGVGVGVGVSADSEFRKAAPAAALPPSLQPLVEGLDAADAFALDARLRKAARLERLHLSQLGPWLLVVSQKRLFWDLGFHSLDAYAQSELGLASSKARALVRLERLALVSPCFRKTWRKGALSWTRAEALAPLFEIERAEPWQPAWLAHARSVTVRRLRDDVDQAIALEFFEPAVHPTHPAGLPTGARPTHREEGIGAWRSNDEWSSLDPTQHAPPTPAGLPTSARPTHREEGIGAGRSDDESGEIDPLLHPVVPPADLSLEEHCARWEEAIVASIDHDERAQLCFNAPRSVTRIFHAVLATVQRRIERAESRPSKTSEALDWMLEHVFEAWGQSEPVAARYRIHERDGWRCAVPGCSGYRDLQVHHIEFRSRGGNDAPENLVTMCLWHHLRGIHGHAYHGAVMSCRGKAPRGLRFSLGLRETGPPLAVYRSGDRAVVA